MNLKIASVSLLAGSVAAFSPASNGRPASSLNQYRVSNASWKTGGVSGHQAESALGTGYNPAGDAAPVGAAPSGPASYSAPAAPAGFAQPAAASGPSGGYGFSASWKSGGAAGGHSEGSALGTGYNPAGGAAPAAPANSYGAPAAPAASSGPSSGFGFSAPWKQ